MKKYSLFIGIDVSKLKLDAFLLQPIDDGYETSHLVIVNNRKGIHQLIKKIRLLGIDLQDVFVCLETTGVYSMPFCYYLSELGIDYSIVSALEIKRSLGIRRGKTDKADAKAIANFGLSSYRKLKLTRLPEKVLLELKVMISEREKIIKSLKIFRSSKESQDFLPKDVTREVMRINCKTVKILEKRLSEIDKLISHKVKSHQEINQCYALCRSVPGVGPQTAVNMIIATEMFTKFKSWRKLACYAGIAPFEYSSGSSIRGRTKVNHIANKKLKSLLNMAALSAKRSDKQIALYYERKLAEGKNKMLVINAIRCKVVSRLFAVVNRGTPFVETCKYAV